MKSTLGRYPAQERGRKEDKEDYITSVAKMCHATDVMYVVFLVFLFRHVW